jgi:hypothetical protein
MSCGADAASHAEEPMSANLAEFLKDDEGALAEGLAEDLKAANAPHYRGSDPALLRSRCAALVAAFVESGAGDPSPFVRHVRRVTEERISEGYYLPEIQHALSSLEARAWRSAIERSNILGLTRNLSIITITIGQAKDELARLYLAHKETAEKTVARLQERLDELSKGTEGHVEPEA